jgi:hypothetical protein
LAGGVNGFEGWEARRFLSPQKTTEKSEKSEVLGGGIFPLCESQLVALHNVMWHGAPPFWSSDGLIPGSSAEVIIISRLTNLACYVWIPFPKGIQRKGAKSPGRSAASRKQRI